MRALLVALLAVTALGALSHDAPALVPEPLHLVIRPLTEGQARLDAAFARQEASAHRVLASICSGCGGPGGDGSVGAGLIVPVLPPLDDAPTP